MVLRMVSVKRRFGACRGYSDDPVSVPARANGRFATTVRRSVVCFRTDLYMGNVSERRFEEKAGISERSRLVLAKDHFAGQSCSGRYKKRRSGV